MRILNRVLLSEADGSSWAHQCVEQDCLIDSVEWLDYPRSALIARETLETISYFITDGIVEVGDTLDFVLARELPEYDIEFWWADDIPEGAEIISRHSLTVDNKAALEQ